MIRIDRFLSNLNYGTRKEIDKLVKEKKIKVNNEIIKESRCKIDPLIDKIFIEENEVFYKEDLVLILNKPCGFICSNIDELYPSVLGLLKEPYDKIDFKIAGRLDQDTTGLIILCQNGKHVHLIANPKQKIDKEYLVTLDQIIDKKVVDRLLNGVFVVDGKNISYTAKALKLEYLNETELLITIDEGKFHQVKRMFNALDYNVIKLKRIRIGKLRINDLQEGQYQEVTIEDIL